MDYSFLSKFKIGEFLYPSVAQRLSKLSRNDTKILLNRLLSNGYLEQRFFVICPYCDHYINTLYPTVNDIPESVCCPYCGEEFNEPKFFVSNVFIVKKQPKINLKN